MLAQRVETHPHHHSLGLEKTCLIGRPFPVLLAVEGNRRLCPKDQQGHHVELQGRGLEPRHQNLRQVSWPTDDTKPAQVRQGPQDSG